MESLTTERSIAETETLLLDILFDEIKKADIQITEDQIAYISSYLLLDIRRLISIFQNIIARANSNNKVVSDEIIKEVFEILSVKKEFTPSLILEAVADVFKVERKLIVSRSRKKSNLIPRQVYFYLCRDLLDPDITLEIIAKTANRSHATVLHSIQQIEQRMLDNPKFSDKINQIKNILE